MHTKDSIHCTDNGKGNQYQPEYKVHKEFKKNDTAKLVIIHKVLQFLYEKRNRAKPGMWMNQPSSFFTASPPTILKYVKVCVKNENQ